MIKLNKDDKINARILISIICAVIVITFITVFVLIANRNETKIISAETTIITTKPTTDTATDHTLAFHFMMDESGRKKSIDDIAKHTTETTQTTHTETTTRTSTETVTTTAMTPAQTKPVLTTSPEPENVFTYYYYNDWTWIGDSRTVGMAQCVDINSLAESAIGLDWFLENSDTIYNMRNQTIVINLGINDIENAYNYVDVFNNMPDDFTQNNCIYIMAVNPVDEEKETAYGYSSSNASIQQFNNIMRSNLRNDYFFLDTYDYLVSDGFDTIDGVHYDANTYIKIYNYVVTTIIGE